MKSLFIALIGLSVWEVHSAYAATQSSNAGGAESPEDRQRIMGGMPTRAELKLRRARATNAPVSFLINPKTERLEARDIDGAIS